MTADHKQNYLDSIRAGISVLLYPVQYVVNFPFSAGSWIGENFVSRENLLDKNKLLLEENTSLKARMLKFESLEAENVRLRELLDAPKEISDRILAAELIAIDMDPFSHKIVVNKGSMHDLYLGQPVIDAEGVFGQTTHITPLTATVMLITDPSHSLPVQFKRTGLRSIAAGTGDMNTLELMHIPNNADIKEGELIVTSGLGEIFPSGYPVAVVKSFVQEPTQPYAKVTATPLAELAHDREVLMVWRKSLKDRSADTTTESGKKQ